MKDESYDKLIIEICSLLFSNKIDEPIEEKMKMLETLKTTLEGSQQRGKGLILRRRKEDN